MLEFPFRLSIMSTRFRTMKRIAALELDSFEAVEPPIEIRRFGMQSRKKTDEDLESEEFAQNKAI